MSLKHNLSFCEKFQLTHTHNDQLTNLLGTQASVSVAYLLRKCQDRHMSRQMDKETARRPFVQAACLESSV